jgi:hypothetical protein
MLLMMMMVLEDSFRTLFSAAVVARAKMTPDATRTRPRPVYSRENTETGDIYFLPATE